MRAKIELTEAEKIELKKLKSKEKNNKIYRRYLYLEMSNKGLTNLDIADYLGVCNDTLTDWRRIFLESGLEGISKLHYEGRRESKLKKYEDKIRKKVEEDQVATLAELQSFIKKKCKVEVEQSWLSRYCKKNSIFLTRRQD